MKKKNNTNRNDELLIKRIFAGTISITHASDMSDVEYKLRRVGGAFELTKRDAVTDAELGCWLFGELVESRSVKRFAILAKRDNTLRTVARAATLVECLNKMNNIIDIDPEVSFRFTMEELARLGQLDW